MNFFARALVIGPRGNSSGSVTCAAVSNAELTAQIAELKARQDAIEQSMLDKIRADVQSHFQRAGININTLDWLQSDTNNGESVNLP